jgi:hypothetical protein
MHLHKKLALLVFAFCALASFAAGCGRYAVRPDEKEYLADRIMQFDVDAQETSSDQHVLTNREGSTGGYGAGGGGCGCN